MSAEHFPAAHSAQILPAQLVHTNSAHKFGAQIRRTKSAQILPRTFVHKFPGRKFCAEFSGEKLEQKKIIFTKIFLKKIKQ